MRRGAGLWLFLLAPLPCFAAHPCKPCHSKQVAAYAQSAMAASLRRAGKEPDGAFTRSDTRFTVHQESKGLWQQMARAGETSEYRVAYVIGSGRHASGYLIQLGDHLFQSPICYYKDRRSYDLAPGYE